MICYPLKFIPVYQERLWGGNGLAQCFGRSLPIGQKIGESWEIAAHANGTTLVANGPWAGRSIPQLIQEWGSDFLGSIAPQTAFASFPLLIKLIDSQDQLSIQVHPDEAYAAAHESEPAKLEFWYIIAAQPGATITYGLKSGVTRSRLEAALAQGDPEDCLNRVTVKPGDLLVLPPGLVHALGAGITLVEIQRNSDLTYRIYDYQRLDQNGQPRRLDLAKALEVIRFDDFRPDYPQPARPGGIVFASEFFKIDYLVNQNTTKFSNDGRRFYILTNLSGSAWLEFGGETLPWSAGESVLLPAALPEVTIKGPACYLRTYLP